MFAAAVWIIWASGVRHMSSDIHFPEATALLECCRQCPHHRESITLVTRPSSGTDGGSGPEFRLRGTLVGSVCLKIKTVIS